MRSIGRSFTLALLCIALISVIPREAAAQGGSVSFQVFYDDLSPYGTWVNNPTYGYVWVPNEGPGFVPYQSGGHWVYTEYGWTWVSDYAWGWAPFHYGRWYTDPVYGAMWVPDNEWGPAWVTWRHADGYYGWAPMEPGISVSVYVGGGYNMPADRWCFVHDRDFGREDIRNHYVNHNENVTIINHSTVINNTVVNHNNSQTYAAGPANTEVSHATGRQIAPVAIHDAGKPGKTEVSNNQVVVYRPNVQHPSAAGGTKPAPAKVAEMKDVKPAAQRGNAQPVNNPAGKPAAGANKDAPNSSRPQGTMTTPAPAAQPNKNAPAPVRNVPQQKGPAMNNSRPLPPQNNPAQRPAPQQPPVRQGAPAQQPARQAPPQQIRQAPIPRQQEPIRQAPVPRQTEPMRQAPVQQPRPMQQQTPQQQPRMEQPRQAPQQQAPPQQPRMEQPRPAPQQQAPPQQHMEQPRQMPQQQAPPQQAPQQAPHMEQPRQAPPQQAPQQAPHPEPNRGPGGPR